MSSDTRLHHDDLAALRRAIMVRNLRAQSGRSSWAERSSANAPAATSLVMTLPDPT
jgi:hypothetical protein